MQDMERLGTTKVTYSIQNLSEVVYANAERADAVIMIFDVVFERDDG